MFRKKGGSYRNVYHPDALSRRAISQILLKDKKYSDAFFKPCNHPFWWGTSEGIGAWYGGTWFCDVEWKTRISAQQIIDEGLIQHVNENCESFELVKVFDVDPSIYIQATDSTGWIGEISDMTISNIKEKVMTWNGQSWIFGKEIRGHSEIIKGDVSEIKDTLSFVPYKDKVLFGAVLSNRYNPYLILAGILGENYRATMAHTVMNTVGFYRAVDMVCGCGKPVAFDLLRNENMTECPVCQNKRILLGITKS